MFRMITFFSILTAVSVMHTAAESVYLTMGFRVGEVTQTSAVVWMRVCSVPVRRKDGIRDVGRPGAEVGRVRPFGASSQ